ncbi:unnamed protein product [Ectocarpus sp. CCAP 1310/34]|nr:unnamed protein product [Ectocarpus sp. CCAP 1310/34]
MTAVGVEAVAAAAAAAAAPAAGRNAETSTVASAAANASAVAAAAPSTGNSGGLLVVEQELEIKGQQQREEEESSRASEEKSGRDWELAHSVAVASLNNVAVLLSEQGDAEQAEAFHRRALRARELVHGPDHPDVPLLLSNLAGTLFIQGKDSEAEPLHQRALQLREALLDSTHPDVATSLEFLARMALQSGKTYTEMEGLVIRLANAREARLTGCDAPPAIEVGSVMSDLALALRQQKQEQATRAFPLFRRVFLSDAKILGCYHPLVAEDVVNLAIMTALVREDEEPRWAHVFECTRML